MLYAQVNPDRAARFRDGGSASCPAPTVEHLAIFAVHRHCVYACVHSLNYHYTDGKDQILFHTSSPGLSSPAVSRHWLVLLIQTRRRISDHLSSAGSESDFGSLLHARTIYSIIEYLHTYSTRCSPVRINDRAMSAAMGISLGGYL